MTVDGKPQPSISKSNRPLPDDCSLASADLRALLEELGRLSARYSAAEGPRRLHARGRTDGMVAACKLAVEPAPVLTGMISALETALETRLERNETEVIGRG